MIGKTIYQAAVEIWGRDPQLDMAIEEMSELIKAILKLRRAESHNSRARRDMVNRETREGQLIIKAMEGGVMKAQENLIGEWADIQLMLAQIQFMVPGKYQQALEDKMTDMQNKLKAYDLELGVDYDI